MSNPILQGYGTFLRNELLNYEVTERQITSISRFATAQLMRHIETLGVDVGENSIELHSAIEQFKFRYSVGYLLELYDRHQIRRALNSPYTFGTIYQRFGQRGLVQLIERTTLIQSSGTTPISRPEIRFVQSGRLYAFDADDDRFFATSRNAEGGWNSEFHELAIAGSDRAERIINHDRALDLTVREVAVQSLEATLYRVLSLNPISGAVISLDAEHDQEREDVINDLQLSREAVLDYISEEVSIRVQRATERDSRATLLGLASGGIRGGIQIFRELSNISDLIFEFQNHPFESLSRVATIGVELTTAMPDIVRAMVQNGIPVERLIPLRAHFTSIVAAFNNDNPALVAERTIETTIALELLIHGLIDIVSSIRDAPRLVGELNSWLRNVRRVKSDLVPQPRIQTRQTDQLPAEGRTNVDAEGSNRTATAASDVETSMNGETPPIVDRSETRSNTSDNSTTRASNREAVRNREGGRETAPEGHSQGGRSEGNRANAEAISDYERGIDAAVARRLEEHFRPQQNSVGESIGGSGAGPVIPESLPEGTLVFRSREVLSNERLFHDVMDQINNSNLMRSAVRRAVRRSSSTVGTRRMPNIRRRLRQIQGAYPDEIVSSADRLLVAELTEEAYQISGRIWRNNRSRIWQELYHRSPDTMSSLRRLEASGDILLPENLSNGTAPLIRYENNDGGIDWSPLNIDHMTPRSHNPFRVVDPSNLRITTPTENSVWLETVFRQRRSMPESGPVPVSPDGDLFEKWLLGNDLGPARRKQLIRESQ